MSTSSSEVGLVRTFDDYQQEFLQWVRLWSIGQDRLKDYSINTSDLVLLLQTIGFIDTTPPEKYDVSSGFTHIKPPEDIEGKEDDENAVRLTIECKRPKHKFYMVKLMASELCRCEDLKDKFFWESEDMLKGVYRTPKKTQALKMSKPLAQIFHTVMNCLFNMFNGEWDPELRTALADAFAESGRSSRTGDKSGSSLEISDSIFLPESSECSTTHFGTRTDQPSDSESIEMCTDPEEEGTSKAPSIPTTTEKLRKKLKIISEIVATERIASRLRSAKSKKSDGESSKEDFLALKDAFVDFTASIERIMSSPVLLSSKMLAEESSGITKTSEELLNYVQKCVPKTEGDEERHAPLSLYLSSAQETIKKWKLKTEKLSAPEAFKAPQPSTSRVNEKKEEVQSTAPKPPSVKAAKENSSQPSAPQKTEQLKTTETDPKRVIGRGKTSQTTPAPVQVRESTPTPQPRPESKQAKRGTGRARRGRK